MKNAMNIAKRCSIPTVNLVIVCSSFLCAQSLADSSFQQPADSSQLLAAQIIESEIPVLVEFWAPWCKPCHMLNPIIKEVEKAYHNKILVVKVNIDIHRLLAGHFRVSAIPAVFIVNNKTVTKAFRGLYPKKEYIRAVEEVLAMSATQSDTTTSSF